MRRKGNQLYFLLNNRQVRKFTLFVYSFTYFYIIYCSLDISKINGVFPFIHFRTWLSWVFVALAFSGITLYTVLGNYLNNITKEDIDAEIEYTVAKPLSGIYRYVVFAVYTIAYIYLPLFYYPTYALKFSYLIMALYLFAVILFSYVHSDFPILYSPMFIFSTATYLLFHEGGYSYALIPFRKLGIAVDYFVGKKDTVKTLLVGNNTYYVIM
jgi:hypothetical protein